MDINDTEERTFTLMDKPNADQQQENKGAKKNEENTQKMSSILSYPIVQYN